MRSKEVREAIKTASLGVLDTLVDSSLFLFAFWAQSYSLGSGKKDIFEALGNSCEFVKAIRTKYLKRGAYQACRKDLLRKVGENWELTEFGKERLESILPKYHTKRPWDGRVYLVTYDIPEKRKRDRDILREYLKRIGCGMFQASVWLTPYNPRSLLSDFIAERSLAGLVVVSNIGRDGNVGQIPLRDLVFKVYKLDKLNERYREFIAKVGKIKSEPYEASFLFYSILKDDPQLPFSLLPQDWLGERAYKVFLKSSSPS